MMPEQNALPAPIEFVSTIQVFSWMHEYRTASFAKIEENLVSSSLRKKKNRQKRWAILSIALVAVAVTAVLLPKHPAAQAENAPVVEYTEETVSEYQMFDHHAKKAMDLTRSLPGAAAFKENFVQLVSDKEPFLRLMEGIAECDSAIMIKNQYGDKVVDSYNIEDQRNILLNLRQEYLNTIMDDVKVLLDEDGAMFANQDMEIAGILALPNEKNMLDSIRAVIKQKAK